MEGVVGSGKFPIGGVASDNFAHCDLYIGSAGYLWSEESQWTLFAVNYIFLIYRLVQHEERFLRNLI